MRDQVTVLCPTCKGQFQVCEPATQWACHECDGQPVFKVGETACLPLDAPRSMWFEEE